LLRKLLCSRALLLLFLLLLLVAVGASAEAQVAAQALLLRWWSLTTWLARVPGAAARRLTSSVALLARSAAHLEAGRW
jgi:hypothetical protein